MMIKEFLHRTFPIKTVPKISRIPCCEAQSHISHVRKWIHSFKNCGNRLISNENRSLKKEFIPALIHSSFPSFLQYVIHLFHSLVHSFVHSITSLSKRLPDAVRNGYSHQLLFSGFKEWSINKQLVVSLIFSSHSFKINSHVWYSETENDS